MNLRLTCLGGAAAWPNPGQGCSSYLISSSASTILVDAGPNTLLELRKHVLYSQIDAVIISHCHADHILDLIPYRYGLVYGKEQANGPIPLFLPPAGTEILRDLASVLGGRGEEASGFWDTAFEMQEYVPTETLLLGDIGVTFHRTEHAAECYAMRFECNGACIVYTADTGEFNQLATFAKPCDLLIAEATMPEDSDQASAGHLTPSQAGMLAASCNAGSLLLTHLWSERPDAEVIAGAGESYSGPIDVVKPGTIADV